MKRTRLLEFGPIRAVLVLALVFNATGAVAEDTIAAHPGPLRLTVQYAETFGGVSSLYAVRGCAGPTPPFTIVENQSADVQEVLVRLVDVHGGEISRHSGAEAVCTYVGYALAYAGIDQIRTGDAVTDARSSQSGHLALSDGH